MSNNKDKVVFIGREEMRDINGKANETVSSQSVLFSPPIIETDPETVMSVETTSPGEGKSEGAIDPVTGEINWDCPCLKDAIAPPCGDYFKAAFSCFVRSTAEPKGEDCMSAFVAMQNCYIAHPEIYKHYSEDEEKPGDLKETIAKNLDQDVNSKSHFVSESASLSS